MKADDQMRRDFMDIAWRDFINFAAQYPDILAQFKAETGHSYGAPVSGIAAMIDEATGYPEKVTEEFVLWVTERHWGIDEAPEKVRAAIEALDAGEEGE